MPKAKDSEENNVEENEETQQAEGLSLRDALEVAIEAEKDEPIKDGETNTPEIETDEAKPQEEDADVNANKLHPPAEWDKEDKELFYESSPKQQEAALKLNAKRQKTLEEIKIQKAELQWIKDLEGELTPYLKSVGEKLPTREAILKAVKLRNEIENGDGRENAIALLKLKGIPIPKELLSTGEDKKVSDPETNSLRSDLENIKIRLAQEDQIKTAAVMQQHWLEFEQEKNAAGMTRFPDLNNTESGLSLASNIGSLVTGKHADSPVFLGYVKARIPAALNTPTLLFAEAYKWFNGRVDDSSAPRTQDTQKHIARSSRAASSVPGRAASSASSAPPKKMSRRDALAAAIAEVREAEGA